MVKKGVGELAVFAGDLIRLRIVRDLFVRTFLKRLKGADSIFDDENGKPIPLQYEEHSSTIFDVKVYPVSKKEWKAFEKEFNIGMLSNENYSRLKQSLGRMPILNRYPMPKTAGQAALKKLGFSFQFYWLELE